MRYSVAPFHRLPVVRSRVDDTGAGEKQDAQTIYELPAEAFDRSLGEILLATGGFDSVKIAAAKGEVLGDDSGGAPDTYRR